MEKIRISDVWVPPTPNRVLKSCGIDLVDKFSKIVCNVGNDYIGSYCKILDIKSPKALHDLTLHYTGLSAKKWKDELLMNDARWYLLQTILPIADISKVMHFKTTSAFSSFFKSTEEMTPTQYREVHQVVEEKVTYIIKQKGE